MRVVDHMLIEHSIWVAHDNGRLSFVFCQRVVIVGFFRARCEKHCVDLDSRIVFLVGYPPMFTIEVLCQHVSHLFILTIDAVEKIAAGAPLAAAIAGFHRPICTVDIGF